MSIYFKLKSRAKTLAANLLIQGVTTKNGVPLSCEVRAYSRRTGDLLNQSRSDASGRYILLGLQNEPNYVLAIDPVMEFNIATQDNVK